MVDMLMTHPTFASSSMAAAATTNETGSRTMPATNSNISSTLATGSSTVHTTSSSATSSSSLSSLFERVTNFRRSLIKNQARSKHKSATRPVSGTFSFFNGKALQEQNSSMSQNSVSSSSLMLEQYSNDNTPDDAIYGFTAGSTASLRLRMQRLNLSMGSQGSPPLSLSNCTTPSSPPLQLYETIDETKQKSTQHQPQPKPMMDPTRPLPALPTQQSPLQSTHSNHHSSAAQICQQNKSASATKSTSYLRAKQSSNCVANRHQNRYYTSGATSATILPNACPITGAANDDDWKRNRRSSAIIFGTDFSADLIDQHDTVASANGPKAYAHLNRSSDDLLLASRSRSHAADHKGIYENLRCSRTKVTSGIREDRKLTKDSGYESASTLVNVGMQNHASLVPHTKQAPNGFSHKTPIQPHSRSESIDSNNSLDLYQSVETRAFDSVFNVRTTDGDSAEDDSPPPTPPIRYSSLAQNRLNSSHQPTLPSQQQHPHQMPACSKTAHNSGAPHPVGHKHLKQDSIVSFVSSGSGGSQISSHSSSASSSSSSNGAAAFMQTNPVINYNQYPHTRVLHYSLSQPNGTGLLPLPNDGFIQNQPVNYRMVDVLPSSPPPPLPPKNRQQTVPSSVLKKDNDPTIVNDIKAIQKRAVYEFYLRQKEKKLKEKELGSFKLAPSSPPSTIDYAERFDLPPLPTEVTKWTEEEEEEEEFPPPPTPLNKSVDYLSSVEAEPESVPAVPVSPLSDHADESVGSPKCEYKSQIYRGIDLSSIWPNVDFTPLLNIRPPVKESDLDVDEDGDEFDEELVVIERAHKSQLEANWQQTHLESIRAAAESEMLSNEHRHASLFKLEHGSKLESLCADVTMITRLLVSIVGQITQHNPDDDIVTDLSTGDEDSALTETESAADSIGNASHRTRLLGQLEDAKRLRDNIDTRRTMFVARVERRSVAVSVTNNTDLNAGDSTQLASELADYLATRERTLVLTEFVKLLSNPDNNNSNIL